MSEPNPDPTMEFARTGIISDHQLPELQRDLISQLRIIGRLHAALLDVQRGLADAHQELCVAAERANGDWWHGYLTGRLAVSEELRHVIGHLCNLILTTGSGYKPPEDRCQTSYAQLPTTPPSLLADLYRCAPSWPIYRPSRGSEKPSDPGPSTGSLLSSLAPDGPSTT